ncbi:hypothetical protein [Massilia sp. SYSU DXS3249]
MLRVGNTDNGLVDRLGTLAARAVEDALASGLSWDEAIVAFGIASKALAAKAATQGTGTLEECTAHAQGRLQFGMEHSAEVLRALLR